MISYDQKLGAEVMHTVSRLTVDTSTSLTAGAEPSRDLFPH